MSALAWYGDRLVAAGDFEFAAGLRVNAIASWDGLAWDALDRGIDGDGFSTPRRVTALAVHEGVLVVGGYFGGASGVPGPGVVSWNGVQWNPMSEGLRGALPVAFIEYGGQLIGAGEFSFTGADRPHGLARWDGREWRPLGGEAEALAECQALAIHEGALIVSGRILHAGADTHAVFRWDGTRLQQLGASRQGVTALLDFRGVLIRGGHFRYSDNPEPPAVERWDGTDWEPMDGGPMGFASALGLFQDQIVAAEASGIRAWDGSTWHSLANAVDGTVAAFSALDGDLVIAGAFTRSGSSALDHIARWDGEAWHRFPRDAMGVASGGPGSSGAVFALTTLDGDLIAGGNFKEAGGAVAGPVARFDGTGWSTLGGWSSIGTGSQNDFVTALCAHQGALVVGGSFLDPLGHPDAAILSWDGRAWNTLGPGITGLGYRPQVSALVSYGTALIAGGEFYGVGELDVSNVALWDGAGWNDMAGGVNGRVTAAAVFEGSVIVAGEFSEAGGMPAPGVARWEGGAWTRLGTHDDTGFWPIETLCVHQGALYAGGAVPGGPGEPFSGVVRWNGSLWERVGEATAPWGYWVSALASYGDRLAAGGYFRELAGGGPGNIAVWDGASWSILGEGTNSSVNALAVAGTHLFAGGTFSEAGGRPSARIACWDPLPPSYALTAFTAARERGRVIVRWSVDATLENPGFILFRGWMGPDTRLTPTPLLGRTEYTFVDSTASDNAAYYWLRTVEAGGTFAQLGPVLLPPVWPGQQRLEVAPIAPNPARDRVTFQFHTTTFLPTRLHIVDASGRRVATLVSGTVDLGAHRVDWSPATPSGGRLPSGVYFAHFEAGGDVRKTLRFVLVR